MINIRFPKHPFKIKRANGKEIIFDECRKRWVSLTPEEWVRQNFLQYLIQEKHYPLSLVAVEREIILGDIKKRFDIVVFKDAVPWMIIECKEMAVQLTEAAIKQILNYNITLKAEYLVVTNGTSTLAIKIDNGNFEWLEQLPDF